MVHTWLVQTASIKNLRSMVSTRLKEPYNMSSVMVLCRQKKISHQTNKGM